MSTAEQSKLTLAYTGSVKRVFQCPWQNNSLLFQFSDDYSVFDWGKMPNTIENKGKALALIGSYFFERLSQASFWQALVEHDAPDHLNRDFLEALATSPVMKTLQKEGLASHFQGLVTAGGKRLSLEEAAASTEQIYMQVEKAQVQRPTDLLVLNQNIFHYPPADNSLGSRLIPLEVVFRFGMPAGSSLKERLVRDPAYAQVLGLKSLPEEGKMFDRPVLEFYTKLEPKDRLLSVQEALLISGLAEAQFLDLVSRAQLSSLALFWLFDQVAIDLWDGKFEFILAGDTVLLADSIGPDELRLLHKGTQLSKEMIRQVYRGTKWETSLKEAQKLAVERCTLDWKGICQGELKSKPEPFQDNVKKVVDQLYGTLANCISDKTLFKNHPGLDDFVSSAKANGL